MSRCRHRSVVVHTRWPNGTGGCWVPGYLAEAGRITCRDCGELLPLGPANDTPETAVEVRAAAIAADWWGQPGLTRDEKNGLMAHAAGLTPINDGQRAGWLGAAIATHKEADRD